MNEKTLTQDTWELVDSGVNSQVYLLDMNNSWSLYKVYISETEGLPSDGETAVAYAEHEGKRQTPFTVNSPDATVYVYMMSVGGNGHVVWS